ncbi:MAG: hypothetical protein RL367_2604 [Pseudomonadota bacterium]
MTQFFHGLGLTLESEIDLPGAMPRNGHTGEADVRISLGEASLPDPETTNAVYSRRGDRLLFDAPGVARYLADAGTRLVIEPVAGADLAEVTALLIATALPMLVWMRGGFVLHASAFILPGDDLAVAIAGPSGSGKSTVLDHMVKQGARCLGDDSLSIVIDKGVVRASGLPTGYFLPLAGSGGRKFTTVPPPLWTESAPLGALLVIGQPDSLDRPATGVTALELLLKNRHRPRIPAIMRLEKSGLEFCARLSGQLPVSVWHRKPGEFGLPLPARDLRTPQ